MEVGQKVRIKRDLDKIAKEANYSINVTSSMTQYEDTIMEISEVRKIFENGETYYKVGNWYYLEEMLEPITETKLEITADGITFKNISASESIWSIGMDLSQDCSEMIRTATIKVDKPSISQLEYVTKVLGIRERNDNEMKRILEVYKNKKELEIVNKYCAMMNEVKEKDVYLKEAFAFNKKVNELYNSGKIPQPYNVAIDIESASLKTKAKLDELKDQRQDEKEKMLALVDEVEAQIELCDTYDQKINVLVKYGIIDKESMKVL